MSKMKAIVGLLLTPTILAFYIPQYAMANVSQALQLETTHLASNQGKSTVIPKVNSYNSFKMVIEKAVKNKDLEVNVELQDYTSEKYNLGNILYELNMNTLSPKGYMARVVGKIKSEDKSPLLKIYFEYIKPTKSYVAPEDMNKKIIKTDDEWYTILKYAMTSLENRMEYNITYSTDYQDILYLVGEQNPELSYVKDYTFSSDGVIEFGYEFSKEQLISMRDKVELKSKEIIRKIITQGMTESEKAKAIHDYIVLNAAYDYQNYIKDTIPNESYTAYGVLVLGTGVCNGYAAAFKLLAEKVGIQCIGISGVGNSGPHAWNLVRLDGETYYIDVTWDDPVPDKTGRLRYDYFKLSEEQIKKDHNWNNKEFDIKYLSYGKNSINSNPIKDTVDNTTSINTNNTNSTIKTHSDTENVTIKGKIKLVKGQYTVTAGKAKYTIKGTTSTLNKYIGKTVSIEGYRYKTSKAIVYMKSIK